VYQALYRKWRPRTFDDVVGQSHITETLKHQVSTDRLSHAYLFIGTRGTGKTTCAKILAKAVNCEHPVNGNPCNACRICRGIDDGSIMDVVEMDAASNNGVDNVRQLRDEAVFSPASAKKRVYIIDEVHMMSTSAFNALLKILEEPPEHLMFILATTELNKVPATILSRCQRHSFKRLDVASVVGRLNYVAEQEQLRLTPDAAALIAGLAEGGMRDALSMLDQCSGREKIDVETVYSALGLAGNKEIAALLTSIADHDSAAAITRFEALWQGGKDPATLLGELSDLMRDLLMRAVAPKGGRELLSGGYDEEILNSLKGTFTTGMLVNNIGILQTALGDMRGGQAKIICELALITLCEPGLSDTLPMLRERVNALEQAVKNGVTVSRPTAERSPAPTAEKRAVSPLPGAAKQPDTPPTPSCQAEPVKAAVNEWEAPPPPTDEDAPPFDLPFEPEKAPAATEMQEKPVTETAACPKQELPEVPVPAAATVPETPSGAFGGDLWEQIKGQLNGCFPMGIQMILTDPMQVNGVFDGRETLMLTIQTGFASNMVDRPDVTGKIASIAGELAGAPVQVKTVTPGTEIPAETAPASDKLDALGRFDIVKFK